MKHARHENSSVIIMKMNVKMLIEENAVLPKELAGVSCWIAPIVCLIAPIAHGTILVKQADLVRAEKKNILEV